MAPVAITSATTSPPGVPFAKSQLASVNTDRGIALDEDGDATPYSSTSTAVSEAGGDDKTQKFSPPPSPVTISLDETLPPTRPRVGDSTYYTDLVKSSEPTPQTKVGSTVFASAIHVLEGLAVQHSESVWVYDDAVAVGFGSRLATWDTCKVHSVQTRRGAGLELAGYSRRSTGRMSVFATTSTLPHLIPSLNSIQGDVVLHLATTAPLATLDLGDSLFHAGVVRSLATLPDGWDVVFSSEDAVNVAAQLYAAEGKKTIHVVESTRSARETTAYIFPAPSSVSSEDFTLVNADASEIIVTPTGAYSNAGPTTGVLSLNTLNPSPDAVFAALTGPERKSVSVLGGTKADADALKSVILAALYSASGSSKAVFPTVKSVVVSSPADLLPPTQSSGKTISFYTAPSSPLPQLLAHLYLSSPSLHTRLAEFGSSSTRGLKSVLSLSPATSTPAPLSVNAPSDLTWVSDANVLKSTDVLADAVEGGILVLELPWTEEEVPAKLSRSELVTIKEKHLRVFLLDLDTLATVNPIREQVAFLLLYTGQQRLPRGVQKVLDAFHGGELERDDVEVAQAALFELDVASWVVPELEEGKTDKTKSTWEWDALPGEAGLVDLNEDEKPARGSWELAARHLFFREAFAVSDVENANTTTEAGPGLHATRPTLPEDTFIITVTENRRLTPMTYERNLFHLGFDTSGTGFKYEIGESLGVHGWNDTNEVSEFCDWYSLEPDSLVSFPNPLKAGTNETRTVFQILQQNLDLFGKPGKAFYAALAKLATSKADAMTLKFISAPEGAELFQRMAEKETLTYADVLYKFRTARPSIEELVGLIPEIKPRHYSIASSQKVVGDKVELLIVTVDWMDSKGG